MARQVVRHHKPEPPIPTAEAIVRIKVVEEISKVVRTLIVGACAAFGMYECSSMIHALAGKVTAADIGVRFLGKLSVSEGLAYAIATVCVGYGYKKSRSNQDMAKRLKRLSLLEEAIDPNRSSSHLTERGSPPEEDENEFS